MLTAYFLALAVVVASLFGIVAWMASAGHSVRVQRTALVGAALAAVALLAPSPWALLVLAGAVVALARPQVVTHLAATGAIAVAFAGHLFLPGAAAATHRDSRSYAAGTMDRAYIASLKSDLRNVATTLEATYADRGRFDAVLLAPRGELLMSTGNSLVLSATADRWHAWAFSAITDKVCDHGLDQLPTCPVTVPVDSAAVTSPRSFSREWVRDSLPADHWLRHLPSLTSGPFRWDSVLAFEAIRMTVTDSGWTAERELAGWHCVTGTEKLAPAGVAPGGFVCHLNSTIPGGAVDAHAH